MQPVMTPQGIMFMPMYVPQERYSPPKEDYDK